MKTPQSMNIEGSLSQRLFLITTMSMLAAAALSILATVVEFNYHLRPFLIAKTETVAQKVKNDIEYALSIGVPFARLQGVDEFLSELTREHLEVRSLVVSPGSAQIRNVSTEVVSEAFIPDVVQELKRTIAVLFGNSERIATINSNIRFKGEVVAHVSADVNPDYIIKQMQSVFFDSLVILVAVALVALEIVVVLTGFNITQPLRQVELAVNQRASGYLGWYNGASNRGVPGRFIEQMNSLNDNLRLKLKLLTASAVEPALKLAEQYRLDDRQESRDATIIDARIPLFVFCVAEELQKSFMPLFVAEYYKSSDLFEKSIMIGLPISSFMFVVLIATPFGARLVDKFGNRRLFLAGLVPAILGYIGCYIATSANEIVFARSLTGVGYAVITISAQSYIAEIFVKENRARGMAIFVGVLMAATMCGTAIGGILADWIGYKSVFLVSVLLASIAGILGFLMLSKQAGVKLEKSNSSGEKVSSVSVLFRNTRFILIVLFCAIPAKIVLTGFLYLFVPIYLASLEASQTEIGRVMMLYSLIIIPTSPLASRFADKIDRNLIIVISATVLSGITLIGLYQSTSTAAVLLIVAILGLVHSFLKAPLIVAAMEAAELSSDITRTNALSFLRTFERLGSVAGPVLVASMLVVLDFQTTAAILGAGIAFVGVIMGLITLASHKSTLSSI
jgi:predicted MFS family arabinose efflux permease